VDDRRERIRNLLREYESTAFAEAAE